MEEYNKYISRKNKIMNALNSKKVNKIILNYLKENNIDINSSKISYLIKIIKKALFNYMMYGEDYNTEILNSDPSYLYNVFEEDYKDKINNLLPINDMQNINEFVLSSINPIVININTKKRKLQKTS